MSFLLRVKPEDDDAKTASIGLGDLEANRESRDIFSRERVWRNRTTILQESKGIGGYKGHVNVVQCLPDIVTLMRNWIKCHNN